VRFTSCLLAAALAACGVVRTRMAEDDPAAHAVPPVSRLGRWDGTHFVEVTPGSLPPSTLRVLVHGWTPFWDGSSVHTDHQRGWELTSPMGDSFEPWMADLARMIVLHDPHAVVVAYSWADESSTPRRRPRRALAQTTVYGQVLAEAVESGLATDFYESHGRIQFVGHSYGARVAAVAAAAMSRPPAQLTMFDAPDGLLVEITGSEAQMPELLTRLPIGWGSGHTFVDNYVSMIGRRYAWREGLGGIRDVSLAPPFGSLSYRNRHLYPMRFYADSPGHGYGYDWSPLTGRASAPEGGCYEQRVPGEQSLVLGCTGAP
jgi:hypothetical protein